MAIFASAVPRMACSSSDAAEPAAPAAAAPAAAPAAAASSPAAPAQPAQPAAAAPAAAPSAAQGMTSKAEASKAFTAQIAKGQTKGLQELKTEAGAESAVIPPIAAASDAKYGGTIKIGYFRKAASMDGRRGGSFDRIYMHPQNEYLTTLGRLGGHDPAESLAYAYEVLDDGMRIRFHIREGVEFQRGIGTMTASDVAFVND